MKKSESSPEGKISTLNLRASPELLARIDQRRAEMLNEESVGHIPSRSEFVRMAVEAFLRPRKKGERVS